MGIVQLVGRDSLSEDQKLVLDVTRIIREDYLAQNAYTDYDKFCPFEKSVGMMNCLMKFYEQALRVIENQNEENKMSWNQIREQVSVAFNKLPEMEFSDPAENSKEQVTQFYVNFEEEITAAFAE